MKHYPGTAQWNSTAEGLDGLEEGEEGVMKNVYSRKSSRDDEPRGPEKQIVA